MANLMTGLFETASAAEEAVSRLKEIGYTQNEITVIMKDRAAAEEFAIEVGSSTMEGVGTGAAIGGTIGAVMAGVLMAVGSVAIPGVGLLVAGPLAAMLAGAGAGGLAGGLLGWLVGAGIPEDVAPYYERALSTGGVVVVVAAHEGEEDRVRGILNYHTMAYDLSNVPAPTATDYPPPTPEPDSTLYPTFITPENTLSTPEQDAIMNMNAKRNYDLPTTEAYHTAQQTNREAARTLNSTGAEQRSAERTAAEHEREARRDESGSGFIRRTETAVENEADRMKTAVQNQSDKIATGAENIEDRIREQ